MKKNNADFQNEYEKLLKEKMNKLSDSVDCFDKISAMAFPEKDRDFSDCGSTVSDLENVTGKRNPLPVFKWVAAAAALVLCIGVIPKTALFNSLKDDPSLGKKNTSLSSITDELSTELKVFDYMVYDVSLDYYISNDVLLTPLYRCPFEKSKNSETRTRVFIKMCNGVKTNQIYAVEYEGTYDEKNFIAAADSKAKFTAEEIEELEFKGDIFNYSEAKCDNAVRSNFTEGKDGRLRYDSDVSVASFTDLTYFKDENVIYPLTTDVLYYHVGINYVSGYTNCFYDTYSYHYDNSMRNETVYVPAANLWKSSVYSDGSRIKVSGKDSNFIKENIFGNKHIDPNDTEFFYTKPQYRMPQSRYEGAKKEKEFYTFKVDEIISTIPVPYDNTMLGTLKIYIAPSIGNNIVGKLGSMNFSYSTTLSRYPYVSDFGTLGNEPTESRLSQYKEDLSDAISSMRDYYSSHYENDHEEDIIDYEKSNYALEIKSLEHALFEIEKKIGENHLNEEANKRLSK